MISLDYILLTFILKTQQKVGNEYQLYSCKLRETPKAYPTAVQTTTSLHAADEVMFIGW